MARDLKATLSEEERLCSSIYKIERSTLCCITDHTLIPLAKDY